MFIAHRALLAKSGAVPDATISFASSGQSSADATSYTFSSMSLGSAAANRTIIVAVGWHNATSAPMSSVTVAGNTMIELEDNTSGSFATNWQSYDLASGTTGDIVVTFTAGATRCGIGVWALYGVGAYSDSATVATESISTVTIPAGGVAIGYSVNHNPTATVTWTNMTERFDDTIDYTSHSGADTFSATEITPTITCDWPTRDSGPFTVLAWPKG